MKFPHTMIIRYVTEYDDYGQVAETSSSSFKCCVLEEIRTQKKEAKGRRNQYDVKILVNARTYAPYSAMFEDNDARCVYNGIVYEIIINNQINSFSGKPRYYEISLKKVVEQ